MFNAILVERDPPPYRASLKKLDESQLPEGDVTVRVELERAGSFLEGQVRGRIVVDVNR
jgi:hypothetical protein